MSNIDLPQKRPSSSEKSSRKQIRGKDNIDEHLKSINLFIKTFQEIKPISIKCFLSDCLNDVVYECIDDGIFTCELHVSIHFKEDLTKAHNLKLIEAGFNDKRRDKLVDFIWSYNADLKSLKKKITSRVSMHFLKVNNEMGLLFKRIDEMITNNEQKMLVITSKSKLMFENIKLLDQYIKSDFQKEFSKDCQEIRISNDCLRIFQTEINDWNSKETCFQIAKVDNIEPKLEPKISHNKKTKSESDRNLKLINNDSLDKLLYWCDSETNQVHYFDFHEETHKSITIYKLNIPEESGSISIDQNNILLCGGLILDERSDDDKFISKVYKIDIKTQTFKILASMKIARCNFSMTCLNGFYYAIGGDIDWGTGMKECERYSLENNKWQIIAKLKKRSEINSTCVSIPKQNCIYIFSGKDIEKYDPEINKWTIKKTKSILTTILGSFLLPNSNSILVYGASDHKRNYDSFFYNYENGQLLNANPINTININLIDMIGEPIAYDNKIYSLIKMNYSKRGLSVYDVESGVWSVQS